VSQEQSFGNSLRARHPYIFTNFSYKPPGFQFRRYVASFSFFIIQSVLPALVTLLYGGSAELTGALALLGISAD
jgi:hypothetical protein